MICETYTKHISHYMIKMSFKSALVMRAAEISNNYNSYIKIFSVAKND